MKKFLLKVSVFIIYALALHIIVPLVIDPFNIFHAENIRDNGIQPNQNYIKMKYILDNPDLYNGFLFGSSRVGALHTDKILGEKVYNLAYPNGLPAEHLANITTFLKNDIKPSVIYIGVDSLSYTEEMSDHIPEHLRCPYEVMRDDKAHFFSLYLNPFVAIRSLMLSRVENSFFVSLEGFCNYGWTIPYGRNSKFDWEHNKIKPVIGRKFNDALLKNTLDDMRKIADLCYEHNIKLVVFTNPMYYVTYAASLEKKYYDFLEGIAGITDFYNFSGFNTITLDRRKYREPSHYTAEIGDLIIDIMCNGKAYPKLQAQGFGVKVTRENIKDFINMLKQQAEDYRQKNSPAI